MAFEVIRSRWGVGVRGRMSAELKSRENRRAHRQKYNDSARIRFEGSFGSRPCQLLDGSRTGARLALANTAKIPDKLIFLDLKYNRGWLARVKWRRGAQIGIEFLRPVTSSNDTTVET
jgi:hypothetical protein